MDQTEVKRIPHPGEEETGFYDSCIWSKLYVVSLELDGNAKKKKKNKTFRLMCNGPLVAIGHMIQATPCWIASYALGHTKQRKFKFDFVLDVPVRSLLSSKLFLYHVAVSCKGPVGHVADWSVFRQNVQCSLSCI